METLWDRSGSVAWIDLFWGGMRRAARQGDNGDTRDNLANPGLAFPNPFCLRGREVTLGGEGVALGCESVFGVIPQSPVPSPCRAATRERWKGQGRAAPAGR